MSWTERRRWNPGLTDYEYAIKKFGQMGLEVQVTELDVDARDDGEKMQKELATRYRRIMMELVMLKKNQLADITGVTF